MKHLFLLLIVITIVHPLYALTYNDPLTFCLNGPVKSCVIKNIDFFNYIDYSTDILPYSLSFNKNGLLTEIDDEPVNNVQHDKNGFLKHYETEDLDRINIQYKNGKIFRTLNQSLILHDDLPEVTTIYYSSDGYI
ncbi:MAG: hypothetical protein K2K47_10095, partial [Duncaniella sp.]|nr:hypothetical protein [Duncaniella sp.]